MAFASPTTPQVASIGGGRDMALADLGAYYTAVTPAPGTGIVAGVVATFVETTPFLVVFNSGLLNIYPVHLQLLCSVVDTTDGAAKFLTNTIDQGNRLSAIGSGVVLTKSNLNSGSQVAGGAVCTAGPITASAATGNRRIVSHSQVRSLKVHVVHDTIAVNWGGSAQTLVSGLINNSTTHSDTVVNCAPIVIGPGQSMVMVYWGATYTVAPTYEVAFAYIDK